MIKILTIEQIGEMLAIEAEKKNWEKTYTTGDDSENRECRGEIWYRGGSRDPDTFEVVVISDGDPENGSDEFGHGAGIRRVIPEEQVEKYHLRERNHQYEQYKKSTMPYTYML